MRAQLLATVSIGFLVLMQSAVSAAPDQTAALDLPRAASLPVLSDHAGGLPAPGASSTDARGAIGPFAPPAPLRFEASAPLPFVDVTGSIAPPPADSVAPSPAREAPVQPIVLPPPDLPPPLKLDGPVSAAEAIRLDAAAMTEALANFTLSEPRRPGETLTQARQRGRDREAIAAFYAAHDNAPLWIDGDRLSSKAHAALARIDRAGEDGLNLGAYAVPAVSAPTAQKLAALELAVSDAVVAYARQASGGRIDPLQIDPLITAKPTPTDPAAVLAAVSSAADPSAVLRAYNPPQPAYAALRDKLAELRQQAAPMAHDTIPSGRTLKLGMRDPRVPLIRSRFGLDLPSEEADDGLVYDTQVAAAVADFQRSAGLPASGALNAKTIAALSGGDPARLENEIISNMERWRWEPRDLGADHISVNIPDFTLEVVRNGEVVHQARVVVGKPDHQTPVFSDTMRFIIVNPYWNVPLSIIKKEMMPKLAADPNYFANHGYEVVERDGQTYVRQPPGEDNALGQIKFMFPNQHSVYLHDTNARSFFARSQRALSHGCVRVDQPFKLAEAVLGADRGWTEQRVRKLIGGTERTINLPVPLPIHIGYFTAFVDDAGELQLRDDVYGYSGKVKVALGLKD